jgi:hypothetical protein
MDADHHDLVLAVTSHTPHLIAYTMVGVADDLRRVTDSEVIKYSAAGFRDFTRIAASDPTMWRDVFLSNKDATLEILGRFTEELFALQRAIRTGRWRPPARLFHPHARDPAGDHRGGAGHRRAEFRAGPGIAAARGRGGMTGLRGWQYWPRWRVLSAGGGYGRGADAVADAAGGRLGGGSRDCRPAGHRRAACLATLWSRCRPAMRGPPPRGGGRHGACRRRAATCHDAARVRHGQRGPR